MEWITPFTRHVIKCVQLSFLSRTIRKRALDNLVVFPTPRPIGPELRGSQMKTLCSMFGPSLTSPLATAQKNGILTLDNQQLSLKYLDDTVIFSQSLHETIEHVQRVLLLLQNFGEALSLTNCIFFAGMIDYFCHHIRPRRLVTATHTTNAVKRLLLPSNITNLSAVLALCNVLCSLMSSLASMAALLDQKLNEDQTTNFYELPADELKALCELLDKLLSPPIYAFSFVGECYILDIHAIKVHVGCILLQKQLDGTTPTGYGFWSLTKDKHIYDTTLHIYAAIVWLALILRPNDKGTSFTIQTYHNFLIESYTSFTQQANSRVGFPKPQKLCPTWSIDLELNIKLSILYVVYR